MIQPPPFDASHSPHPLFPSGEWEGFYVYGQGLGNGQHKMFSFLEFRNGGVEGDGYDDVAAFIWSGVYDTELMTCKMTKRYTTHTVFYDGRVDENGIWGTWIIQRYKGGFHIWPKKTPVDVAEEEKKVVEIANPVFLVPKY